MTRKGFVLGALVLTGALATGAAQAGGGVNWSVAIGAPGVAVHVGQGHGGVYVAPPVTYLYSAPPVVRYRRDYREYGVPPRHGKHGWRDRDHDGIPNRYDRVDNRRWDADGDGIPNRHDRRYNPRGDRDRDGIPNWRDPNDRSRGWRGR